MTTYTYTTIDPPGSTNSLPTGINDLGQIVGTYETSSGQPLGFLYSGGTYTTIDPATNINDAGQIVGIYENSTAGFLYSGGAYTTIDPPGSNRIETINFNVSGEVVGTYVDSNGVDHGFLYDHGNYAILNVPGALNTVALNINASGQVVGRAWRCRCS